MTLLLGWVSSSLKLNAGVGEPWGNLKIILNKKKNPFAIANGSCGFVER
jgi:hypothetical protein